uniref:Uncharacterized protein n=1 Tax=Lepeophtheirus salmonis TaxID=72036 RepID=A0A0K2V7Q9_LEPSM
MITCIPWIPPISDSLLNFFSGSKSSQVSMESFGVQFASLQLMEPREIINVAKMSFNSRALFAPIVNTRKLTLHLQYDPISH